jgi:cysteine sulfinate desulfinase/cysteine desulfurase-like protein
MVITEELTLEVVRISQGWTTTDDDIQALLDAINTILKEL